MTAPRVSIIVPSYNQGAFIRQTLQSILSQDYRPLEVLVMDGGSTDDTVAILREVAGRHPELRWWSERDGGPADAVNKGLARAAGTYAGIQSSDDVYRPGAIADAVALLDSDPAIGVACGDVEMIDERDAPRGYFPNPLPFAPERFLSRAFVVHQSSAFFRLALAREAGGWDARYFCCDTHLWLRLLFRTRFAAVPRTWSAWRMHDAQRNREARRMRQDWGRMLDDCAELRSAPAAWRRAARAGRHALAVSYSPQGSRVERLLHGWRAVLAYPPAWRAIRPWTALVPGLGRVLAALRRHRPELRYGRSSHDDSRPLPADAAQALRDDHPRLAELRRRYAASRAPMAARTMWDARYVSREMSLRHFRGDNPYVWQKRHLGRDAAARYAAYYRALAARDCRGLLGTLQEDGLFGCWTFAVPGGPVVSRDLLDSAGELQFLDRQLGLLSWPGGTVLDIGAGYGRLAHRMLAAAPRLSGYVCVDAIPESTFVCEYYLRFRQCGPRAEVVPLDELEVRLAGRRVELAVNVHSFSEMSAAAVDGWVALAAQCGARHLFVVPNDGERLLTIEADGSRRDFRPTIERHGFRLLASEPAFAEPALRAFMGVHDQFFLFERAAP